MRKPIGCLVAVTAFVLVLSAAPAASAATEAGSKCSNVVPAPAYSLFTSANPGSPPGAAPISGVVTSWSINFPPEAVVPQQFKVARLVSPPTVFQVIGESATVNVVQGLNTFPVRIPVQAGDIFGLYGNPITIICAPVAGASLVGFPGNVTVGQSQPFLAEGNAAVPAAASIEPDADNDGFGDETQDKCPQSAALQVACPVTVVDSFALPQKGKVLVLVATSTTASVTVAGKAKLPKTKKAKKSAQAKLNGVTKVVAAGSLTRFSLKFPASLKSAVASLPKGKSVTLNLTATAPNLSGPATTDKAKVKLKG